MTTSVAQLLTFLHPSGICNCHLPKLSTRNLASGSFACLWLSSSTQILLTFKWTFEYICVSAVSVVLMVLCTLTLYVNMNILMARIIPHCISTKILNIPKLQDSRNIVDYCAASSVHSGEYNKQVGTQKKYGFSFIWIMPLLLWHFVLRLSAHDEQ